MSSRAERSAARTRTPGTDGLAALSKLLEESCRIETPKGPCACIFPVSSADGSYRYSVHRCQCVSTSLRPSSRWGTRAHRGGAIEPGARCERTTQNTQKLDETAARSGNYDARGDVSDGQALEPRRQAELGTSDRRSGREGPDRASAASTGRQPVATSRGQHQPTATTKPVE